MRLRETLCLWDYLKTASKPVVLYGMGDGADKILNVCAEKDIAISGVFASDGFVRGQSFRGFSVESLAGIKARLGDFIILLSFASSLPGVLDMIYDLAEKHELYAPDVPVCGGGLFDRAYLDENYPRLETAYNLFDDDFSKETYLDILDFKLSGKINYLRENTVPREALYRMLPAENARFADAGAYTGDTVMELIRAAGGKYQSILALEPDRRNFKKLTERLGGLQNIRCENTGVWSCRALLPFTHSSGRQASFGGKLGADTPVDSIDNILAGEPVTIIKYDVEGAEREALLGSRDTIKKYRPALMVSAYHRNGDIFELPLLIRELCPDYRLYLRRPAYIPAWDSVIIATV